MILLTLRDVKQFHKQLQQKATTLASLFLVSSFEGFQLPLTVNDTYNTHMLRTCGPSYLMPLRETSLLQNGENRNHFSLQPTQKISLSIANFSFSPCVWYDQVSIHLVMDCFLIWDEWKLSSIATFNILKCDFFLIKRKKQNTNTIIFTIYSTFTNFYILLVIRRLSCLY